MNTWIAFIGGVISFASPCVLPLIPTYIIYLTGSSITAISGEEKNRLSFINPITINAFFFVIGFSLIFIAFGATASLIGTLLFKHQIILRKISGIIIIIFGLYMMELIKLAPLSKEIRFNLPKGRPGPLNSLLIGMAFSVGWTPCVGPVLGSILTLASNSADLLKGVYLLGMYSIGFGLPFILTGIFISWSLKALKKLNRYLPAIKVVAGIFMVGLGTIVYTGVFNSLFIY